MAKNSKKLKGRIVPERLADARENKGLTQAELAYELEVAYASSDGKKISTQLISHMENGRRQVPLQYNVPLSQILGVSVAYLQGITDDKTSEEASEIIIPPMEMQKELIPYDCLFRYDNCPVFVEFLKIVHPSTWCIYDRANNRLVSKDFVYQLSIAAKHELRISVIPPEYITQFRQVKKKSLTRESLMKKEYVYIVMNSTDPSIRARYEGWYRHNESHTNLINAEGLTLPYSGMNISYLAYDEVDETDVFNPF